MFAVNTEQHPKGNKILYSWVDKMASRYQVDKVE